MRWMDCLLLSVALGSSLFTGYVLAVRPLDREAPPAAAGADFQAAVIHESRSCSRIREFAGSALPYHFLISASGDVVPTAAWRSRRPCESTMDDRINATAVAVLFETGPAGTRPGQWSAFQRLLQRLKTRDGLSIRRVYLHSQIEPRGCAADIPR